MTTPADAWNRAAAALPAGWRLEGLRCTSTGLDPSQRGDGWLAEACGPGDECIKVGARDPLDALVTLAERLLEPRQTGKHPRPNESERNSALLSHGQEH
ncbi:MAG TPA: hypothetical protein VFV59_10775 [Candidatus Limnocylindria bacterium]|nr:hypothetical protein [Candidatus Limnocylindria bacterium]